MLRYIMKRMAALIITSDQLVKLQTLGLSVEEAEKVIVDGFLK